MTYKLFLVFGIFLASVLETGGLPTSENRKYTCRTFGSGVVQPYNGTLYYVDSNCPFTFTRFTHNRVECTITTRRGDNGLLSHVEIMINKIRTVLQNGVVQVEGKSVHLPYDQTYQHIFHYGIYTKLRSLVLPLSVVWHNVPGGIETFWVELELQLGTDMTGLCGNLLRLTKGNTEKLILDSVLPDETCQIHDPVSAMNTVCRMFFSYTMDCLMYMTSDYLRICEENIYHYQENQYIRCSFFNEVVQQCGNNSYVWQTWRTITECTEPNCPGDLDYVEQGAAFVPSCSSPKADQPELTRSCVCANGLVLNDCQKGFQCVNVSSCPCVFGDDLYKPGDTRSTKRETCLCDGGRWLCTTIDLPPLCSFEGHIVTTFDGKQYTIGGECTYVAAQSLDWKIIIEYAERAPTIKSVHLKISEEESYSFSNNMVKFGDEEITELHESEHTLVCWQSSMFVQVYTTFELKIQIQMSPEIQLYISPPPNNSSTISGLCGNNNRDTTDDFTTSSGIIENSAQLFARSWSVGSCQRNSPPSCIRTEYEIFADEKCSVLINPTGIFAACHGHVPTDHYHMACIQRTCSCGSHLHQCLCSALSSYVKACTSLGVDVGDWRKLTNCTVECPGNQKFSYNVVACNRTCRSLSGPDFCCLLEDGPVEGCGCPEGTHLNMGLTCSPKAQCFCHYNGGTTPPGPAVIDGRQCICEDGQLRCSEDCGCTNGKVCVHCSEYEVNTLQKTCDSLRKPLGSSCESGCYCPLDQYEDHNGNCVPLENCTCSYSGKVYAAGESVKSHCKTCVCSHGQWLCTDEPCPGKCQVYGNGHYQTFDSKWFRFDGHCQYTLVQDDCGLRNGTFSVRIESVPCCEEALTCSRSIILDIKGHFTLTLSDMKVTEPVRSHRSQDSPLFTVHTVGLYIVISVPSKGLTLIWDKHTWITVELLPHWRREVCGLCGNFDSNEINDLQIKDSSVVLSPMAFGNSWKSPAPPCSDVTTEMFPCERNSYCAAWAQRRCLLITGDTFKDCHLKVDPEPYYQACVQESCSCEFEGRFLGFCTAVAAYAEACSDSDVCVNWRTPDLCPVYCDYYNEEGHYVWHHEACGSLLTCGLENYFTHKLEGCYPRCPEDKPYYDENTRKCTALKNCTCLLYGTVIEPESQVVIDFKECYCQNGTIKCPPLPSTTVAPPTSVPTTPVTSTTSTETTTMSTSISTTTTAPTTTTTPATTTATTLPSTASTTAPPTASTSILTSTTMPPSTEHTSTSVTATTTTTLSSTSMQTYTTEVTSASGPSTTSTSPNTSKTVPTTTTSTPHWSTTSSTVPTTSTSTPNWSTTSTSTTITSTSAYSTTTKVCECMDLKSKQKWQCGETWTEDCFQKSCTDNKLQLTPVQCPESSFPSCPREQAVKVSDGCCETWTCDCRCELYGDPHYISFQGVQYDFLDDCTYILVEEQSSRYNLMIAVDNFYCMPGLGGSCVKGVIVKYKDNTATLNIVQSFSVQAALNDVNIRPPFEQNGMKFETTGYITTLYLPEIRSYVSLSPTFTLIISLAMENFVNNTQGQCGVCGGGSCVRRGGYVEDNTCCEKTAYDWIYQDPQKPECVSAPRNISCDQPPSPPPPPCPSRPLCELLRHPVFAGCSKYVDLNLKKKNCDFDSCQNPPAGCSSLEQAANECKKVGFPIEWRKLTNESCDPECPEGQVFQEHSCKMDDFCVGGETHTGEALGECSAGCVCPRGQIRASRYSEICVDSCHFCKGPLGEPKTVGEVWQSNCHICTCNNQTLTEECSPIDPGPPPSCGPTQMLVKRCCNLQVCVEKTCSYNGTLYELGETWTDSAEPCMSFSCSIQGIQTETKVCPTQNCLEEGRIWDDQHCCFTCESSCAPVMATLNVTVGQCSSELQISVCDGLCHSQHRVILERAGDLWVEQDCSFCQERSSEPRNVTLQCSDQTNSTYTYHHITSCECTTCGNQRIDYLP